ncbi:hypothetical protein Tco_0466247 [Tanacetum coccineum]
MGDVNHIRSLGDYSKPSHEGYMNTIELSEGNNVAPLRSDTIQLVQNGCSFHGIWSEDPNQHLKDFLKLVDSLDLDGANRERTRLRLFQFSLRDQASNWLERLPAGSITTWEDLTTLPHHGIDLWLQVKIFYDHVTPATRRTIDQSASGKLRDRNVEESWALLEDLALYDNKSWNDPRDFAKLDDTPVCNTAGSPTTHMNFTSTNYPTKEELRGKGIKSPSNLLSPKYMSQSSLAEQNRNPSSLKHVHFLNSIVILNKEDKAKEEGNVKSSTTEYEDHEMTVESKEEFEEETKEEIKEEEG